MGEGNNRSSWVRLIRKMKFGKWGGKRLGARFLRGVCGVGCLVIRV